MIGKWDTKRHPTPRSRPKPNVVTECWARIGRCFKTIANFRKDNGPAIRAVCRQFIVLCRKQDLFTQALVASTAASSRPPTTATRTSLPPSSSGAWPRSMRASAEPRWI